MRLKFALAVAAAVLSLSAHVWAKTILPDACGDDAVKFEVKTESGSPALAAPPEGKAQIVLIQNETQPLKFTYGTVRFGLDGKWAGANKGSSYFVVTVEPGVHQACAALQDTGFKNWNPVGVISITAEAGKTYYYEAQIHMGSSPSGHFSTSQLTDVDGQYRVKASKVSTSTPKK